ncbi:MAG: hypothetical protein K2N71_09190, partial [Oscillospiraceae bacterium]|nr:hypothetical protein [Oscillospiraceae bacterium]
TFSETSFTSVETVSEISEATEKKIAETEITEETTTVSETETSAETEQKMPSYEIVDMSNYTGNFYEWEYDYDIVSYDRESFAGGEDIINTAVKAVRENVTYKINGKDYTYGEIAALAEKAEKSEEYKGYVFETDGESLMILNDVYELFYSENGRLEPSLLEGVYEDFDSDGKKESFLCFGMFNFAGSFSNMRCCVVFVDSEGNAELLPEASGEIFDWGKMLNPIKYNGFIHMCTAFGVNNGTHHSEIYAVENGKAVHKKSMFSPVKPFCGAFMLESAAQAPGSWISFWNENEREYYILDTEDITDEEAEALWNSEAFRGNESLLELYESAEQLKNSSGVTGKKYYGVSSGGFWIEAFERTSSSFEKSEYEIICPYYRNEIYVIGIDIDNAQSEMIRLEK